MAEKKKTSSGKKGKTSSDKNKDSKTKYVGKNVDNSLTFFEKNRNAIMLFYFLLGILLAVIALIPGHNLWQNIRAVFFSVFGIGLYFLVIEVFYIAISMALRSMRRGLIFTNIFGLLFVSAFDSLVHLLTFSANEGDGFAAWKEQLFTCAKVGWSMGAGKLSFTGGIIGGLFGGTPMHLFGKGVAIVFTILILFVTLLFDLNIDINLFGEKVSDLFISGKGKMQESSANRKAKNEEKKRIRQEERQVIAEDVSETIENEKYKLLLEGEEAEKSESEEKTDYRLIDDFDFNKTKIENEPNIFDSGVKQKSKTQTKVDEKTVSKPASESAEPTIEQRIFSFTAPVDKKASARKVTFGENLLTKGGAGVKPQPTQIKEELPEDFEEIDVPFDDGFEDISSYSKPVKLSANDKAVVSKAAKEADEKLEKNKAEVKNYKETRTSKKSYVLPSIELLNKPLFDFQADSETEMRATAKKLDSILKSFGVETTLIGVSRGPSVTRYELSPAPGVKISKITSLSDDIALGLASTDVRIEAPIPNKAAVGIEVPNKKSSMVTFREVISSSEYKENSKKKLLTVALGKDIAGNIRNADLSKMPHLLIAGTTGSGKSVCLNCMIASVLYNATPEQVKLLMIDPKQVEFSVYNGIPHLLVPVITDARKAAGSLAWAVGEMDARYKTFSTCGVRDIQSYNNFIKDHPELPFMPQIVIFIDELNDLMMVSPKEVEDSICRLAQKARAAGMHLVVATQRPSVDVITGIIKANIPSRLSLAVSSQVDSRTILDSVGAEKLLGNGDMLFNPVGVSKPVRIQGAFLSDGEIEKIVTFIKGQSNVNYDDEIMQEIERNATADNKKKGGSSSEADESPLDALIEEAMDIVTQQNSASTTVIQRKLSVGYARAARIMDQLEQLGYISPAEGNKPRKVLISRAQFLEMKAKDETIDDDYDVLSDDET